MVASGAGTIIDDIIGFISNVLDDRRSGGACRAAADGFPSPSSSPIDEWIEHQRWPANLSESSNGVISRDVESLNCRNPSESSNEFTSRNDELLNRRDSLDRRRDKFDRAEEGGMLFSKGVAEDIVNGCC